MGKSEKRRTGGPLCLRLPSDMLAGATAAAAQAGVSLAEWTRELIYRAVYNEPTTMDHGYMHGRALGYRVAIMMIRDLMAAGTIPENAEDGVRYLQTR